MYAAHCTLHTEQCTMYTVRCTGHYTVHTACQVRYSSWPINMDEREIPDFFSAWLEVVVNKLQNDLHVRCSTVYWTLHTAHYTSHTTHNTLYTTHYTLQTAHYKQHTTH